MKRLFLIVTSLLHVAIIQSGMLQKSRNMMGPDSKQFADRQKATHKMVVDTQNYTQEKFEAELLSALRKKHENIVKSLIKSNYFTHTSEDYKRKVLRIAVQNGKVEVVKLLLDQFADQAEKLKYIRYPYREYNSKTLLMFAIEQGSVGIVKILLSQFETKQEVLQYLNQSSFIGATSLHFASYNGDAEIVRILLDQFKDDDQAKIKYMYELNYYKQTALHSTAYNGSFQVAQLLLDQFKEDQKQRIDYINQISDRGWTVLHLLAGMPDQKTDSDRAQTAKVILNRFTDEDYEQKKAFLYKETEKKESDLEKFFLYKEKETEKKENALKKAVIFNSREVAKVLLQEFKTRSEAVEYIKKTNKLLSAASTQKETILLLLDYVQYADNPVSVLQHLHKSDEDTILLWSLLKGYRDIAVKIVNILLQKALVNNSLLKEYLSAVTVKDGNNILHLAVANNDAELVQKIVAFPSSISDNIVNERNKANQLPLSIAVHLALVKPERFDLRIVRDLVYAGSIQEEWFDEISFSRRDIRDILKLKNRSLYSKKSKEVDLASIASNPSLSNRDTGY